jgi:hypothetical protein
MKRDIRLMRTILLEYERFDVPFMGFHDIPGFLGMSVQHNTRLLVDCKYLQEREVDDELTLFRITNMGHDFLLGTSNMALYNDLADQIDSGAIDIGCMGALEYVYLEMNKDEEMEEFMNNFSNGEDDD